MFFSKKSFYYLIIFCILQINYTSGFEIKIIARVNNEIITNEDINKEKRILSYFINNSYNNAIDKIALNNLIETLIKRQEIKKKNIDIPKSESLKYLKLVLEKNNKSLEDFNLKLNKKIYEDYLLENIKTELSWHKLINDMFSNNININMDEVISKSNEKNENKNKIEILILNEKNKKLQSISETYFNEVKNKSLIKIE